MKYLDRKKLNFQECKRVQRLSNVNRGVWPEIHAHVYHALLTNLMLYLDQQVI